MRTDSGGYPTRSVDWWDTSTRAHGTIVLAAGHTYVSAGPHGVVYLAGASLRLHTTGGVVSTLCTPFAAGTSFAARAAWCRCR